MKLLEAKLQLYSVPMPPVVSLEDKDYSLVSQNIVHETSLKVLQQDGPPMTPSMRPTAAIVFFVLKSLLGCGYHKAHLLLPAAFQLDLPSKP